MSVFYDFEMVKYWNIQDAKSVNVENEQNTIAKYIEVQDVQIEIGQMSNGKVLYFSHLDP